VVSGGGEILELARGATEKAMSEAGIEAGEVDLIIWASALESGHQRSSNCEDAIARRKLEGFCYTGSWLQEEFGFDQATVMGTAQQGCAGMFGALRIARAMLVAEPGMHNVLCVGADALAEGASREILYNVISDAAVACVLSRGSSRDRWIGFNQITKGYYWDTPAMQKEISAAYFPTARATVLGLLEKEGLAPEDIDLVIPNGIQAPSWPVLLRLVGIPEERLYLSNERFGHTVAADNFILLEEARREGRIRVGDRVLLFTYGFGSSWSAILLQH